MILVVVIYSLLEVSGIKDNQRLLCGAGVRWTYLCHGDLKYGPLLVVGVDRR